METKCLYQPVSIGTASSTNGDVASIVEIPQGVANNNRIGSTVTLKRLVIKGVIEKLQPLQNITNTPVRIMVMYSSTEPFLQTDLVNYLTGSYDPKRFFPLMDRYYTIPIDVTTTVASTPELKYRAVPFSFSRSIRYHQKYIGPSSTDITKGYLTLCVNQNSNVDEEYQVTARVECWYTDM